MSSGLLRQAFVEVPDERTRFIFIVKVNSYTSTLQPRIH
jgi:hypothetical protein